MKTQQNPLQNPLKTNQQKPFLYLSFWEGFVCQDSCNFLFFSFFFLIVFFSKNICILSRIMDFFC